jgi:hypothetical protein
MGYKRSRRKLLLSSYLAENTQRCCQFFLVRTIRNVVILEQIKQAIASRSGNKRRCGGRAALLFSGAAAAAARGKTKQPTTSNRRKY